MSADVVAFVADVHIGNHRRFGGSYTAGINRRCALALGSLRAAVQVAERAGATDFVVLGDLFDEAKPSPQIVAAVAKIFDASRMTFHLLVGNHDQVSDAPGDHAMAPLAFVHGVNVYDANAMVVLQHVQLHMLPFRPRPGRELVWKEAEATAKARVKNAKLPGLTTPIFCVHLGLADEATPHFLRGAKDSIVVTELFEAMAKAGCPMAVAGNWHDAKSWADETGERRAYQLGALAPTGFDNPGFRYGGVCLLRAEGADTTSWKIELTSVPGPRSFKGLVSDGFLELDGLEDLHNEGHALFVRATATPPELAAALEQLQRLRSAGTVHAGEVLVSSETRKKAASEAAAAARDVRGLRQAVAAYVNKLQLPADVQHERVLAIVEHCLEKTPH